MAGANHSGIPHIPLKDACRGFWATRMRNAGVDMDAIRQGLGDSMLQVAEEYLEDDVEWVAEQFDKADGKATPLVSESEAVFDAKTQ